MLRSPSIPTRWLVRNQGTQFILAPGEFSGLPEPHPSADWNEQRFLVINVNHPLLGAVPHTVEVEHGLVTFQKRRLVTLSPVQIRPLATLFWTVNPSRLTDR